MLMDELTRLGRRVLKTPMRPPPRALAPASQISGSGSFFMVMTPIEHLSWRESSMIQTKTHDPHIRSHSGFPNTARGAGDGNHPPATPLFLFSAAAHASPGTGW